MKRTNVVLALSLALGTLATAGEIEPEPAGEIEVQEINAIWWGSSSTGMAKRALDKP